MLRDSVMSGEWAGTDCDDQFGGKPTFACDFDGRIWVVVVSEVNTARGGEFLLALVSFADTGEGARQTDEGAIAGGRRFSSFCRAWEELCMAHDLPEPPINLPAMLFLARGW
jgi:hypothetical protein